MPSPASQSTTLEVNAAAPARTKARQPHPLLAGSLPAGLHVLVIDDDELVTRSLGKMLEALGCEVEIAQDGAAGIAAHERARIEGAPFDIVLIDGTMPNGLGGKASLDGIRRSDPSAKALLVTGYTEDELFRNPFKAGFDACLMKPFTLSELVAEVRQVLGTAR